MRSIYGAILSSVLATAVAGCNLLNLDYYREGIGTELSGSETAAATEDAYLGQICRQAGLPGIINADGTVYCDQGASWTLVVQAGMNDIDRRCDGYLAWLDDKRRSSEPFLKQLAATGASTLGILDATSASLKAITITGIAFGLAANTFTNINSRLLSLEQSTVQSLVLDTQRKFRENNKGARIDNRPMAIHYLRNYLRICLPFSIETSVNNTVTVFHRAGAGALERDNSLFSKSITVPFTGGSSVAQPNRNEPGLDNINLDYEKIVEGYRAKIHTISKMEPALAKLCLSSTESIGERAPALVQVYQQAVGKKRTGKLTDKDIDVLNSSRTPKCDLTVSANYYESTSMRSGPSRDLVDAMNLVLANGRKLPTTGATMQEIRNRISDVRTAFASSLSFKSAQLSGQFTKDLVTVLSIKAQFPDTPNAQIPVQN